MCATSAFALSTNLGQRDKYVMGHMHTESQGWKNVGYIYTQRFPAT